MMPALLSDADMGIGGPPHGALLSDADMGIGSAPTFGSDEYVSAMAKKHGADPDVVRRLIHGESSGQVLKGVPIAGGLVEKAGAGLAALAAPVTGAGVPGSSITERYGKNLSLMSEIASDYEKAHPILSTVSQLGGGALATAGLGATATGARLLGIAPRGAGVLEQAGRGAASGAVINAADAAVRGNDPTTAGVIGGAIGGAVPVVGRAAGAIAEPITNAVRGMVNPAEQAARQMIGARGIDRAAGAGMSDADFLRQQAAGVPVTGLELGGETTRGLARAAANISPEARQTLNEPINERFEGQGQRVTDWLQSTFNYPDAAAQQQALRESQSAANNVNYRRAMTDGARHISSPVLDQIAASPSGSAAMREAARLMGDEAVIGGVAGARPPITFGPNGMPNYADLQFWDLARRQLSNSANIAQRAGDREGVRRFGNMAEMLNSELDRQVPSYAAARASHAAFAGAQDALEAGRNFALRKTTGNAEAGRLVNGMTDQERGLFQDGFVDGLVQTVRQIPDRQNVAAKIGNNLDAREKMRIALGADRANQLRGMLQVESVMDAARGAVQGNSTTVRQLAEMGLAGVGGGLATGGNPFTDPASALTAFLMYRGLRAGRNVMTAADQRVATQLAHLLTSDNPAQLRLGMTMLGRNHRLLENLRRANAALARSASTQLQPRQN